MLEGSEPVIGVMQRLTSTSRQPLQTFYYSRKRRADFINRLVVDDVDIFQEIEADECVTYCRGLAV